MNTIQKIEKGEFSLWLHPDQIRGWTKGTEINSYLKENNLLEDCATKEDLEEIKKKGADFYRKHFGDKVIYAWKSVVLHDRGDLRVPFLIEIGGRVILGWRWVDDYFFSCYPALRFANSSKDLETKPFLPSDLSSSLELRVKDLEMFRDSIISVIGKFKK